MLDPILLRKDLDGVLARLKTRKDPQPFLDESAFRALEAERKTIQTRTEELQAQRNSASKQIGQRKAKGESADELMAQVASIKDELDASAARLDVIQDELNELLLAVPNLPHESVPVGADESANQEVRRWAPHGLAPRAFDFPVRDHVDLGEKLGLDFETGVKLAGTRFSFMRGPVARLHRALAQFMLDVQTTQHGYTECYTPYIVNADTLRGTGQLPKFEADLFAVKKGGQEGEGKVDDEASRTVVAPETLDDAAQPTPEVPADRQNGPQLDDHLERFGIRSVKLQPFTGQNQVSGTRDWQEFGQALDDAEHYGLQKKSQIHGRPSSPLG